MSLPSWLDAFRPQPQHSPRNQRRNLDRRRLFLEGLEERRMLAFVPAVEYPAGPNPQAVVSADFNRDGHLDFVTANKDTVSFRPGDGSGGFGEATTSAAASAAYNTQDRSLAVGDFNNDGNLDLAMVNDYALTGYGYSGPDPSNGLSVMLGNGDGSFQAPLNVPLYQGTKATSVAVGDFNNDGTMDLAVTSVTDPYYPGDVYEDSGLASVMLGNGDGSFRLQYATGVDRGYGISRPTPAAVAVVVADFNGDGNQDFVVGTRNFGWETGDTVEEVAVLLGDGQGNIASESWWRLDHGWSMAAGDLDGDGDADLVTASGSQVHVRLGNGTGGFEAPAGGVSYAAGPGAFKVILGDFNRDEVLDIATANYIGGSVSVLRGNSDGTFLEAEQFTSGPGSNAITAGDFNGDGWLDLATANAGGSTVSILLNDQAWSPAPDSLSISDTSVTEGDGGVVPAVFTVTRRGNLGGTTTVSYSTANGGALAGSDYVAASGTLTFGLGETTQTITVLVNGDLTDEWDQGFYVNLSAASAGTVITDGQAFGYIVDNDPPPTITITSVVSAKEGNNSGTKLFNFFVTLSAASEKEVWVNFTTANGTATTADGDYIARSGTLIFAPGTTSKTISVQVRGDKKREANERFFVNLSGATNATIAAAQGIGEILDDDSPASRKG